MNLQFQSRGFPFYKVNFLALLKKKKLCNLHNRIGALASMLAATAAYCLAAAERPLRARIAERGAEPPGTKCKQNCHVQPMRPHLRSSSDDQSEVPPFGRPGDCLQLDAYVTYFKKYCGMVRKCSTF